MGEYLDYVNQGFRILLKVMAPYVAQELRRHYKKDWWQDGVINVLKDNQSRNLPLDGEWPELVESLDILRCLQLIDFQWQPIFRLKLTIDHRNWVKELINTRHKVAHIGSSDLSDEDAWRAIDTMTRLCEHIDAESTDELRSITRVIRYGTDESSTTISLLSSEAQPSLDVRNKIANKAGILSDIPLRDCKPWRDIIEPHPDVARGEYRNAEFAADLNQVAKGGGSIEYRDPVEFFARTYMTEGLKALLVSALRRIGNKDGDPIIQLKTVFGGGKTHSMLALYHLLRGQVPLGRIEEYVRPVLQSAGMSSLIKTRVAVIVGTAIDPSRSRRPQNFPGITINTLWGEIAAQLAESAGNSKLYDIVRDADRRGVSPGSEAFKTLFDKCGPCLILIDELVAYAKKIHGRTDLPAGSFDNFITFIQELSEGVRASKNSLLVASLPESELEIGGDAGHQILDVIEHTFGRMETIWKPVASNEGFEVVRRRLFLKPKDPASLDIVCKAFSELYQQNSSEFPPESREVDYCDRMRSCYPIHPEVFDRLYLDWATLDKFQRTRGVLRLMAAVIHELWMQQDNSLMIMPASFILNDSNVRRELTGYLSEGWNGVIEREVDGINSIPYRLDKENVRFSKYLAARRIARTILIGSAPSVREQQVRGIEVNRILLGAVQPGENVSLFNDALNHLRNKSTYLFSNLANSRYWFDTRPTLRRTVEDRAGQFSYEEVEFEIENRLKSICPKDNFMGVHICPANTMNIPDEQQARLVVLSPSFPHKQNQLDSKACIFSGDALQTRGGFPRTHRNMLAFVAADGNLLKDLEDEVRHFLAWQSVLRDSEVLNLDHAQTREAQAGKETSDRTVKDRLSETYCWLIVPYQVGTQPVEWLFDRISGSTEFISRKAFTRMVQQDNLIRNWSPFLLKREMDNWFWKDKEHLSISEIWNYLTSYCYLPRLLNKSVLISSIDNGLKTEDYFAYADGFDGQKYLGLKLSQGIGYGGEQGLLVKIDVARKQLENQKPPEITPPDIRMPPVQPPAQGNGYNPGETSTGNGRLGPKVTPPPAPSRKKRFHVSIPLDSERLASRVGKINDEILQHLYLQKNAQLEITLEVSVRVPDGFTDDVVRTVSENAKVLRIEHASFEDE